MKNESEYKTALAESDGMDDPAPQSDEAIAEYGAKKRGQSFEEAKAATFEQYAVALRRLARGDHTEITENG